MPSRDLPPYQLLTIAQDFEQFAMFGGIGTGKSYTGANWSIDRLKERPDLRGFIGANTHEQLSQVALQEFYYWMGQYGIQYIINQIPPPSWQPRLFENYHGITTVRLATGQVTNVFTRVLSKGDNLRGLEFGWFWIDETRDTPHYTHDVIMGRLRQDDNYRRGLVTTTTNAKDWAYKRFVLGAKKGSKLFGSCHIPSTEAVKYGVISQSYLDSLLASYSPLLAQQEIYAKHVNIAAGRAYHGWNDDKNPRHKAPWGDEYPNQSRPLIIGCDFNFTPAPCIWVYGQTGPAGWEDHLHWFGELAETEISTPAMTRRLILQCPGFFYRIFGDASGQKGSTSNAGETDYMQMAGELEDAPEVYGFTIDSDQSNPLVKDRVESVNAMLSNAVGEHRMTYNPDTCPHLHADFDEVGFGKTGKLQGPNEQFTHASDAAGYAVFKLFGPHSVITISENVPSPYR